VAEYQLNGEREHVLPWLSGASPEDQKALLDWLPKLAADPAGVATAVLQRRGVPAYTAAVPGTDAFVDYVVVDQYKTVLIIGVETVRLDDGPRRWG
jgi:hypothetical protein